MRQKFIPFFLTISTCVLGVMASGLDNPIGDEGRLFLESHALPLLALAIIADVFAGILLERLEKEERSPGEWILVFFALAISTVAGMVAGLASNFIVDAFPEPTRSFVISRAGLLRIAIALLLFFIAASAYILTSRIRRRPSEDERKTFLGKLERRYRLRQDDALRLAAPSSVALQDDLREMIRPPLARLEGNEGELQWEIRLSADIRITDQYREQGAGQGKLLILGKEGAGKTFQLLELAIWLVESAKDHQDLKMPVIFSLASWATERKPLLEEWMAGELEEHYECPPEKAKALVERNEILPLFDGLNEIRKRQDREDCARAIIRYLGDHANLPIVACCRQEEYSALEESTRQALRNVIRRAVVVRPLEANQIERFLRDGKGLKDLHTAITADPALHSVVTTPLMLTIIALTYQHKQRDIPQLRFEKREWRNRVFDEYVRWALNRPMGAGELLVSNTLREGGAEQGTSAEPDEGAPGQRRTKRDWLRWGRSHPKEEAYPENDARRYLTWLATQMERHGQPDIFYLHQMQPDWLPGGRKRPRIALTWNMEPKLPELGLWLKVGAAIWVGIALFIGISIGISTGISSEMLIGLAAGVVMGAITAVFVLLFGLGFGHIGMAANWLKPTSMSTENEEKLPQPDAGIRRSRKNGWVGGVLAGLVYIVGISLILAIAFLLFGVVMAAIAGDADLIPDPSVIAGIALAVALVAGVFTGVQTWHQVGGGAYRQHMKLRRQLKNAGYIPKDFVDFLDFAAKRILLQRDGGGYRFYHPLLLEYFVDVAAKEESREVVAVASASQSTE